MSKKIPILLSLLLGAIVSGYLAAPRMIRSYAERRLPQGVEIQGPIRLGLDGIVLRDVVFNRGWVRGTLQEVTVISEESVDIRGGSVMVDLDLRTEEAATGQGTGGAPPVDTLTARGISAHGLGVTIQRGEEKAVLTGGSWDGTRACFQEGDVTSPRVFAHLIQSCYYRHNGDLTVGSGTVHLPQVPKIPGLDVPFLDGHIENVRVTRRIDDLYVQADRFDLGPLSGTEVSLSRVWADGLMYLDARTLTLAHPWLAPTPSTFQDVHVSGARNHTVRIFVGTQVGVEVNLDTQTIKGQAPCQEWVRALPENLRVEPLSSLSFTGMLSFEAGLTPKPRMQMTAACRASCQTFPKLRQMFSYQAYSTVGTRFERRTGPGTPVWLPIGAAGQVPLAVIQMEDPGFPSHRGYIAQAFQNSLIENVQKGRFSRGGSTITQQTAKNLWLSRDKTLGRKVGELFLAQALESCLTKDEILETYLNIVEFGPNIYGLSEGARHWFHKTPAELTPVEAFWLARILPAPRKAAAPVAAVLHQTERLMQNLARQGRIPEFDSETEPADASEWDATE